MVRNFRYEEPGQVALSGAPESPEAVDWLAEQGVRAVVSLHPVSPEVQARLRERGIAWKEHLIADFARGVAPGLEEVFTFIGRGIADDPGVLIH